MKVSNIFFIVALCIISISIVDQKRTYNQQILNENIEEETTDIVIIGGGLGGLSSALFSLHESSLNQWPTKIMLLDKNSNIGGNSQKATSGINGAWTIFQQKQGIKDNTKQFEIDSMKSFMNIESEEEELPENVEITPWLKKLAGDSKELLEFLNQELKLNISKVQKLGGHTNARTHRQPEGVMGYQTVTALKKYIDSKYSQQIEFKFNSTFLDYQRIKSSSGTFYQIKYSYKNEKDEVFDKYIEAKVIIFASGGFGNDHNRTNSLLKEFGGQKLYDMPTTNGNWATGDIIKILRDKNIDLVDMDQIQIHPTGFIDPKQPNAVTKFLAPEALRGSGGMITNSQGERFVDELTLRSKVVEAMENNKEKAPFYLILNENAREIFGKNFDFYYNVKKFFVKYNNFQELFNEKNENLMTISNSIETFNSQSKSGNKFNETETIYVAQITPVIHYTMGGIKINTKAEVINKQNVTLNGLYGVGEVTGGVHGKNRLGGNSLLECVVFGAEAGRQSARYINKPKHLDL